MFETTNQTNIDENYDPNVYLHYIPWITVREVYHGTSRRRALDRADNFQIPAPAQRL